MIMIFTPPILHPSLWNIKSSKKAPPYLNSDEGASKIAHSNKNLAPVLQVPGTIHPSYLIDLFTGALS